MTPNWLVRLAGDPAPRTVPTAEAVLEGIRDGEWEPSDEVRGPGERVWRPIEDHPTFADAIAEMGPPPAEPEDDTKLDMNPLIDVALVLLIFFILTATYATLRRTIDVPAPQSEEAANSNPKPQDLQDRAFKLDIKLDDREEPLFLLDERGVLLADLETEMKKLVSGGKTEMILRAQDAVTWGTEVKARSAATNAGVRFIYMPSGKK
jgi:biopolymer transport protein ExbD